MNKGQILSRTTVCECGYSYKGHPNQMKTARRIHTKVCQVLLQHKKDGYEIEPHVEPPLSYPNKTKKGNVYVIPPNVNRVESNTPIYLTHHATNHIVKNAKDVEIQFILHSLNQVGL